MNNHEKNLFPKWNDQNGQSNREKQNCSSPFWQHPVWFEPTLQHGNDAVLFEPTLAKPVCITHDQYLTLALPEQLQHQILLLLPKGSSFGA